LLLVSIIHLEMLGLTDASISLEDFLFWIPDHSFNPLQLDD